MPETLSAGCGRVSSRAVPNACWLDSNRSRAAKEQCGKVERGQLERHTNESEYGAPSAPGQSRSRFRVNLTRLAVSTPVLARVRPRLMWVDR